MNSPYELIQHMQNNIGTHLTSLIHDHTFHSGNRSNNDPLGKISYVTATTAKGLICRYRSHKQGGWHVWKSWANGSSSKPHTTRKVEQVKRVDIMPAMLKIWANSAVPSDDNLYISNKLIIPIGIKEVNKRVTITPKTLHLAEQYLSPQTLLIPARDNTTGLIVGFETVTPEGRKFARGQRKGVHLWLGGSIGTGDGNVYIAEGYSTGVSVHMRTSSPVLVAFSTSNLLLAGEYLRGKHSKANIIYTADNDTETSFRLGGKEVTNAGVYYARQASKAINALVLIPPISGDFNDWHVSQCPQIKMPAPF